MYTQNKCSVLDKIVFVYRNAVSTKPVDFHTGPGINTNDIKCC